jgi:acyl-coenzyme A thioesterase PaaI-like protein
MSRELFDIYLHPPQEINALGRTLSTLIHRLLAIDPIPESLLEELVRLREQIETVSARMAPHERSDRVPRILNENKTGVRPYYVQGALLGEHNPFFPAVEIRHNQGVTTGNVRFGVAFEGPPGHVHGGFVALLFDGILGYHNTQLEIPAMTAKLDVRYRKPTPVLKDLRFEVRSAEVGARQIIHEGWIMDEGERVAEARGSFALPRSSNYMDQMLKKIAGTL